MPDEFTRVPLELNPQFEHESMFAAEIHIHKFLTQQREILSRDPYTAEFVFVPIYSSAFLTVQREQVVQQRMDPHQWQRNLVEGAIRYIVKAYPGLFESRKSRFVWVFSHDFGACLNYIPVASETTSQVMGSVVLSTNGEVRSPGVSCFDQNRHIVIPPAVSNEFLETLSRVSSDLIRDKFVYFRGTIEWKWFGKPDPKYSKGIRQRLYKLYRDSPGFFMFEGPTDLESYIAELKSSVFCLCPRGYASWSPRFTHAVLSGCVPVLIAENTVHPWQQFLDYEAFSVQISESELESVESVLKAIHPDRIQSMRKRLAEVAPSFVYQQLSSSKNVPSANELLLRSLLEMS
jgi:hypothetical protein